MINLYMSIDADTPIIQLIKLITNICDITCNDRDHRSKKKKKNNNNKRSKYN